MAKKIKPRTRAKLGTGQAKKDIEQVKKDLEKTGEAIGGLFKGLFGGISKIIDTVQDMEESQEKERSWRKGFKGLTKGGKEFRGETGWRIKTGILDTIPGRNNKEEK